MSHFKHFKHFYVLLWIKYWFMRIANHCIVLLNDILHTVPSVLDLECTSSYGASWLWSTQPRLNLFGCFRCGLSYQIVGFSKNKSAEILFSGIDTSFWSCLYALYMRNVNPFYQKHCVKTNTQVIQKCVGFREWTVLHIFLLHKTCKRGLFYLRPSTHWKTTRGPHLRLEDPGSKASSL